MLTALRTLEEQGLLEHERYRGVTLTRTGARQAANIRERHSTLTLFLKNIIGVSAETAEKDACKMEHLLSNETLKKIKSLVKAKKKR